MKYRQDLDYVLRGLRFEIKPQEKVDLSKFKDLFFNNKVCNSSIEIRYLRLELLGEQEQASPASRWRCFV